MSDQGTGVDPKVDYVFKQICGEEDKALVLVDVVNAVVGFPEGRQTRGVMIKNPFVAKEYAEGKVPILDVRACDDPGRQFLLEMQQFVRGGFAKRLLYYWAGGHAEQLLKGERYELLQPTYAICFVNETLFDDADFHHCFVVCDKKNDTVLCKDLEIHVLELNKFKLPVEEVKTPLERWCYFFKHGAALDPKQLPATLDVPVIRQAMEVLVRISQNELERQRYLERQRAERDAASLVADARDAKEELRAGQENAREEVRVARENAREEVRVAQENAREELRIAQENAREEAREEARVALQKGIRIGRIQLLQHQLNQPETSHEDLNRLPEPALVQLEESLKLQLSASKQANGTPPADNI